MRPAPATIAAGGLFAVVVAYHLELIVRPMAYGTLLVPAPLPLLLPGLFGIGRGPVFFGWVAGFLLWNRGLLRGGSRTPDRSLWLWGMFALLAICGAALSYGTRWPARDVRLLWFIASVGLGAASLKLLPWAQRRPSYPAALTAHTLLWLWPVTVAAPMPGEG